MDVKERSIKLGEIPKMLFGMSTDETYFLTGIVNYYGSEDPKSKELGHFTAFFCQNDTWHEYDDTKTKPVIYTENHVIKPRLIFYFLQK